MQLSLSAEAEWRLFLLTQKEAAAICRKRSQCGSVWAAVK